MPDKASGRELESHFSIRRPRSDVAEQPIDLAVADIDDGSVLGKPNSFRLEERVGRHVLGPRTLIRTFRFVRRVPQVGDQSPGVVTGPRTRFRGWHSPSIDQRDRVHLVEIQP